jgi:hypothetical protein
MTAFCGREHWNKGIFQDALEFCCHAWVVQQQFLQPSLPHELKSLLGIGWASPGGENPVSRSAQFLGRFIGPLRSEPMPHCDDGRSSLLPGIGSHRRNQSARKCAYDRLHRQSPPREVSCYL